MAADAKRLARIHRVRTLQLGLIQADEARARDRLAGEAALAERIGQLAAAVAPVPAEASAASLLATAHFREALHRSAAGADQRVLAAQAAARRAAQATQAAWQDRTAVEKLIARADDAAVRRAMRALEDLPPGRPERHDPC